MQANVEVLIEKLKEIVSNRTNVPKEKLQHKAFNDYGLRYEIWHEKTCLAEVVID